MEQYTNELIHESSPYLLQHAHNPVNWVSWSKEAFEKARIENKLVLVSIGYSSCHWCHVMEHESFEDEEVAALMNKFFVCIKVDREERPDIDQVYMTAVQLMTKQGGWPLNCFANWEGSPIYGGTYFPKEQWMHVLKSLEYTNRNEPEKVIEYAKNLKDGIQQSELISEPVQATAFKIEKLEELVLRWSKSFDSVEGGPTRAPKFPLPNNYEFLQAYASFYPSEKLEHHVELTLDKMAMGGIYDQVGGGFSRYSVDMLWKVPHFEKMLYDNGQLLSLYSEAFKRHPKPLYKRIVFQTIEWMEREIRIKEGAFESALDADSEGVEGKFYTWKKEELKSLLGNDYNWVADFYNVNQLGYWEEEQYILMRSKSDHEFCKQQQWSKEEFEANLNRINDILLNERSYRIRPGLDDKCLSSWNGMALKGICKAYEAFQEPAFFQLARKNAFWLLNTQCHPDGFVWRTYKEDKATIPGFLEDYAHVIDGFIAFYQISFEEQFLEKAKSLCDYARKNFQDEASKMFYFTHRETELIARKMELNDNVIPATNSVMANNLFLLGHYFMDEEYLSDARQILTNVYDGMEMYGSGYSNYASLLLKQLNAFYEIGFPKNRLKEASLLQKNYLPQVLVYGIQEDSSIPIVQGKSHSEGIQLCFDQQCVEPFQDVSELKAFLLREK
jgi:uncharacterized protein